MTSLTKVLCAAAGVALSAGPALAAKAPAGKTGQVRIQYVPPHDPAHQPLYEAAKQARVLEKLQAFLAPVRLPRPLLLKIEGCEGVANAWFEDDAVTICYEYLGDIWKAAHSDARPATVTERAALVGPVCDVFFHEIGHALFDYLQIPVLGREEDAADDFSAYLMLQFGKEEARQLLAGVVYTYATELKLKDATQLRTMEVTSKLERFADEHSTAAQRLYNLLCIAYGADQETFATVVEQGWLPKARAEGCEWEYRQVAFAYQTLIKPHVDPRLAKKVRAQQWLPALKAKPAHRPEAEAKAQ